jgi:hypothetical protein
LAQSVAHKRKKISLSTDSLGSDDYTTADGPISDLTHLPSPAKSDQLASLDTPMEILKHGFFQNFLSMQQDCVPVVVNPRAEYARSITWAVFDWARSAALPLSYKAYMSLIRRLLERNDVERALIVVESMSENLRDLEVYKVWILLYVRCER